MGINDDPLLKYIKEERINMTSEEYCALIEMRNEYVRNKHSLINEQETPRFNTLEELIAHCDCIPLNDVLNNMDKFLDSK